MKDRAWLAHLVTNARKRNSDGVYLIVEGRHLYGERIEVRPGLMGIATTRRLPPGHKPWCDAMATVVMVTRNSLSRWILGLAP